MIDIDENPLALVHIPAAQELDSMVIPALFMGRLQNLRVALTIQLAKIEYDANAMLPFLQHQAHLRGQLDLVEQILQQHIEAQQSLTSLNQIQGGKL